MAGKIARPKYSGFIPVGGGVDEYHDPLEVDKDRCVSSVNFHLDGGKAMRRPGRRLWGPSFDSKFRGVHEYVDTDGTSRLFVSNNGQLWNVTSSAKTGLASVADEDLHFHTLRGKCFYNGAGTQKKVVATTVSDVGLDKPSSAPSVATGAAGNLSGSYSVRVTYVIETSGVRDYESDPCDASGSVTLASQQLSVTSIPTSGDSRVNARYIYRTSAGGAKYYYDGKISDNTTTTYTSTIADASLGDEVETNHDQPVQGSISEGCNERMFWIVGSKLYFSEVARTEAYLEYSAPTSFYELPNNGKGNALRRLYNRESGREDLYIFQEDAIVILPSGDPRNPLHTVRRNIGCVQHDTVVEYNDMLVFLTNKKTVGAVSGGAYLDLSTRGPTKSISGLLNQSGCRASIVFDHYYAITGRSDGGKLYNHVIWLCDLRTVRPVQQGMANASWFSWTLDAEYLMQREDGTVLAFDGNTRRIYELSFTYKNDEDSTGGTYSNFTATRRTKNFYGTSLMATKQPKVLALHGDFERQVSVVPYAWRNRDQTEMTYAVVEAAFVMGVSLMGTPTTTKKNKLEAAVPSAVVGNTFSFEIKSEREDFFFTLAGIEFSYISFARML